MCSRYGSVGHPLESFWKLHPKKRLAKLESMSVERSLISELKTMFAESERRIPGIAKRVLEDAERKKNANLGVMNSSCSSSELGNSLYLQSLTCSVVPCLPVV